MLVIEHRDRPLAIFEHRDDLLEEFPSRVLGLTLLIARVVAVLTHHDHTIHRQLAASQRQRIRDGGANPQGGELLAAAAAEIIFSYLVDVERDQVHRRPIVRAHPSITVKETVHDVLGVRVFEIGGNNGSKLGTINAHESISWSGLSAFISRPNDNLCRTSDGVSRLL